MINIKEVQIKDLIPFEDSPFEFREDEGFTQLFDSISESGVFSPIVVCERDDKFEIVSGYRRVEACKRLHIDVIPAIIKELTREEAIVMHVDTNLQRDKVLPSEKAYGYKMKLEALKRQGFRSDLTSDQAGRKCESAEIIASESDDSKTQVRRYIRLTFLIPEILKLVDNERIAFTPAVALSYLSPEEQYMIYKFYDEMEVTPSYSQAVELKNLSSAGNLNESVITEIMSRDKPNQQEFFKVPMERLKRVAPKIRDILKNNDTLLSWINHYLEYVENEVMCDNIKESEYKTLKARLQYFVDYSGGLLAKTKLNDILPSHIQPAVNALYKKNPSTGKNTAKKTLQRYIRALANVFEFARKERAYNFCNPCDDVKIPKNAEENSRTAINKHTIQLILTTEHRAKLPVCIMLLAGLRRGEVTALTWFDIDFKNRIINVNKSYDFKQCELKETKTKAGMRKIPMNDFLYNLLLEAKKHSKGSYIVQKAYGGRMTETAWKRLFESYMEALRTADGRDEDSLCFADERFEEFTAHQLRHTYCSMLQWSGVDIKTAQELMGHSEYGVTANIYTHVDEATKNNAAMLQDKFIKETLIS